MRARRWVKQAGGWPFSAEFLGEFGVARIAQHLLADGGYKVTDNGRGIPVDPHPEDKKKSAAEIVLTTLHAGGKFGGEGYKVSGGLHGVGVSVVNALSKHLECWVRRGGKEYNISFKNGKVHSKLEVVGDEHTLQPDPFELVQAATELGDRLGDLAGKHAIEVPPDGQPIVMLADHPVTGGYPVIAVVMPQHLPSIAQAAGVDSAWWSLEGVRHAVTPDTQRALVLAEVSDLLAGALDLEDLLCLALLRVGLLHGALEMRLTHVAVCQLLDRIDRAERRTAAAAPAGAA